MIAVIFSLVCALAIFSFLLFDKLQTAYRRTKHPEYFVYYDAGVKTCFEASTEINYEIDRFNSRVKILLDGLNDGECTSDYFKQSFNAMIDRYIAASRRLIERREESEKLFKNADLYAKEHKLEWGIIYGDKCK